MTAITVHGFKQLGAAIGDYFERLGFALTPIVAAEFERFGLVWQSTMIERTGRPWRPGGQIASGSGYKGAPQTRSGQLRRSMDTELEPGAKLGDLKLYMFSDNRIAGRVGIIQELGTKGRNPASPIPDITPKRARYLTIPLDAALTESGLPKRGLRTAGDWIRSEGAFFFRSSTEKLYLARETESGEIELLFRLVRKVQLYPRLGMARTAERLLPSLVGRLPDALRRAAEAASGGRVPLLPGAA